MPSETRGKTITTRLETQSGVPQKAKGHLPKSGTDGNEISALTQLVGRMNQVFGKHRAVRHTPLHRYGREEGV